MKITRLTPNSQRGSALVVTVVITAIAGLMLVAYLQMVKAQHYNTTRSQAWNSAVPVIEAGIEDALTHMNVHTNSLALDGWQQAGNIYYIERYIADGRYLVTISNWYPNVADNRPVVESRGYVPMPYLISGLSGSPGPFLANLTGDGSAFQRQQLGRGVRVRAKQSRIFTKGMVARGQIDINGNNISADSFDSSDPRYNTNGRYDINKRKDGGDIASNSGLTNSLNVGNADIMGKVSTGPGGSISIGPNGQVGSKQWFADNKKGVEPGWSTDDMNVDFPDVMNPPTGGVPPSSGTSTNGTNYTYLLTGGNYEMTGLNLSGSETMRVQGNVVLYVTGNINISGNAGIEIAPGSSLVLYMAGTSASIGGNGIVNETSSALNFQYWGMPSNKSIDFGGNAGFIGSIYAPEADLVLHGGGKTGAIDFTGASITKTSKLNGHFNFHYDEVLKRLGPFRGYIATSWDEMTPQEVARSPFETAYDQYYNTTGGAVR